MIAGLSCVSSHGLWILTDPRADRVLASAAWTDTDATGLSVGVAKNFSVLLERGRTAARDLSALYCVTGPGSFTGLRMSSAFVQGLARGLSADRPEPIEARSLPTFDLVGKPFFIPLRHQKARELTLEEALAAGVEFLRISSSEEFSVASPCSSDTVWGTKDFPLWPDENALLRAIQKNSGSDSRAGLHLIYGLEPKISGIRSP